MATDQSDTLKGQYQAAYEALQPLRDTWDEKELALLAKTSDSFSGNVVRARVTDAALSTLAYERQARVAAQLPTGNVYAAGKKNESKAKLANIVLQRYIIPNANSQFDMLIKQRMWGVYASVYGSMPMLYDYRVDDQYIGPDCWLIDPRDFMPQPGFNSVQDCDWVMVSTTVSREYLKKLSKKKKTTYNKAALNKVIEQSKKGKPTKDNDKNKESVVSQQRYTKDKAEGRIELVTKYENGDGGHWITFAPDYECTVIRDIPNPHKSGRIPVVMRHCFPLMNSIYGLGDYERGMRIQKAKDSLIGLFLEGAKLRIFPPLKIDTSKVTASTIKNQANAKWLMSDMNAVQTHNQGSQALSEFQGTYSSLHTMLMNQFGTSDTTVNADQSGNPAYGRTPQALKMLDSRENARDTWDRFMHEKATEELYEGMLNLLAVKMEKPINFTIFEEEIRQIKDDYESETLEVSQSGKYGTVTAAKKDLATSNGYSYLIDANSSMQKDDQAQLEALMQTYQMAAQDPNLQGALQQKGINWDQAEHFKKILISAGVSDWERILKEGSGEEMAMMQQQQMMGQPQDPMAQMQQPMPEVPAPQYEDPDVQAYAEAMFNGGIQ